MGPASVGSAEFRGAGLWWLTLEDVIRGPGLAGRPSWLGEDTLLGFPTVQLPVP